jgi:lipoprotein
MKTKTNNKLFFSLFIGVMLLSFLTLTSCQKDSNNEPQKPQTGNNGKPNNGGGNNTGGGGSIKVPDIPKVDVEPLIYNFNQKLKDVDKNYKFISSKEFSGTLPFEEIKFKEENKRKLVLDTNIKGDFEVRLHQVWKVTNDGEFKNGTYTTRGVRYKYTDKDIEAISFSKIEIIINTDKGETVSSTIENGSGGKFKLEIDYRFKTGTTPYFYLYETSVKTIDGVKKVYYIVTNIEDLKEIENEKNTRFDNFWMIQVRDVMFEGLDLWDYQYAKKNDK